jgi:hypothetical protein
MKFVTVGEAIATPQTPNLVMIADELGGSDSEHAKIVKKDHWMRNAQV